MTTQGFIDTLEEKIGSANTLAEAAQHFSKTIYEQFESTVVLARLFATIPMKDLPRVYRDFADRLAERHRIADQLKPETLVFSLLGSRGENPEWNDPRKSKSHLAIPLVSSEFVKGIAMPSMLLKQLGLDLKELDDTDAAYVGKTVGNLAGTFYVADAAQETDSRGRKIISDQTFVERYDVKTVFGFGGAYMLSRNFIVMIVFTRKYRDREQTEKFLPLITMFKTKTSRMITKNRLFS